MADKPVTTDVAAGSQYAAAILNDNFSTIEDAIEGCLGRGGTNENPNSMEGDLDMDLNSLINVSSIRTDTLLIDGDLVVPSALAVTTLPSQTNNASNVLSTDGVSARWVDGVVVYDNVSLMKSATIPAGILVETKGYYSSGDGGAGRYLIKDTATVDGYVDHTLTGGTFAVLQYGIKLNSALAGVIADGVVDDADSYQAAVLKCASDGKHKVLAKDGINRIGRTIEMPVGIYIEGSSPVFSNGGNEGTVFTPMTSTSYYEYDGSQTQNGYLFFQNVNPASPSDPIVSNATLGAGGLSNMTISGANVSGGIKGMYCSNRIDMHDIRHLGVSTLIRCTTDYYDDHKIAYIHGGNRPNDTEYLIYLPGLGDNLSIDNVSPGYTGNETGITKGVFLGSARGGRVTNIINGIHRFQNLKSLDIRGWHIEGGYLDISASNIHVSDSIFYLDEESDVPILLSPPTTSVDRYQVVVDNVEFSRTPNNDFGWPTIEIPDIHINTSYTNLIVGAGCRRSINISGATGHSQVMGIIVKTHSGDMTTWQNYSHILTRSTPTVSAGVTDLTGSTPKLTGAYNGFSTPTTVSFSNFLWKEATDTYYYGIQMVIDPVRLLGKNGSTSTTSIAATNGGGAVQLSVSPGSNPNGGYALKLYRGTSSGVYDAVVLIPSINIKLLYDDGNAVNGFPWESRSAGGMDPLNNALWSGAFEYRGGLIQGYGTTGNVNLGTWKQGDELRRINLGVDAHNMFLYGYRRLTSGSSHVNGTDWATMQMSTSSPAA